ncbi:MAG: histidinol dehydrogenase [Candidatus Cloacimonetes bacterium 4572_55]|nr:MAG: histidinol dehydrogenase [Candidatus Cloacimonetes bacterium 4572_55]
MLKVIHLKSKYFPRHFRKIITRGDRELNNIEQTVRETLDDVRERGDKAVLELTESYNGIHYDSVTDSKIPKEKIDESWGQINPAFLEAFRAAKKKTFHFHEKQKSNSWFSAGEHGVILGQRIRPIGRVGIYVPGGYSIFPAVTLLNVVPAQLAGVRDFYIVTPPDIFEEKPNPYLLAAAKEMHIPHIYRIGGAQAIGALAYGTESIPRVDKIIGQGNIYVSLAKRLVQDCVGIDMVQGPSEVVILADETAYPKVVALDLLSQAEKDEMSISILITTSKELAQYVVLEVEMLYKKISRHRIIKKSLEEFGIIFLVDTLEEGIDLVNDIAPERLGLILKDAWQQLGIIKNAGAIFIGPYSPESVGDYLAGPAQVLPTGGSARFQSPLSVNDFLKTSNIIFYTEKALKEDYQYLHSFTSLEGFDVHSKAVQQRFSI